MRRKIAGVIHRFAWWLDQRADEIWNVDEIITENLRKEAVDPEAVRLLRDDPAEYFRRYPKLT